MSNYNFYFYFLLLLNIFDQHCRVAFGNYVCESIDWLKRELCYYQYHLKSICKQERVSPKATRGAGRLLISEVPLC